MICKYLNWCCLFVFLAIDNSKNVIYFYSSTHITSEAKNPFEQNDENVNDGGFFGTGTRTVVGEPPPCSQSNTVINGGNILEGKFKIPINWR